MSIKFYCLITVLFLFFACSTSEDLLPENFLGLELKQKLTGIEAKEFVDKLHFNEVTPENNSIGFYEGETGSAIIYITFYETEEIANSELIKMTGKISPKNSVFINSEYIKINDKEVYRCFGMGQSHYVFSNRKELFWVSVDTHFGKKFVEDYLSIID